MESSEGEPLFFDYSRDMLHSMSQPQVVAEPENRKSTSDVPTLLTKYERAIRRLLTNRSGPHVLRRTTIDDLFQETITVAMRKADSFNYYDDARFLAWISEIARYVLLNSLADQRFRPIHVRIKGAASSGVGVAESDLGWAKSGTPSSIASWWERRAALKQAIAELPEHYQRALTIYKLEGRSLEEVASVMLRSKGATCRLIARAMDELRNRLSPT